MARLHRIQFLGANYHVVARGDGRRRLFHDFGHYQRFTRGLQEEVQRSGWIVLAYPALEVAQTSWARVPLVIEGGFEVGW